MEIRVVASTTEPIVTLTGPSNGSLYAINAPVTITGSFTDACGSPHSATGVFDGVEKESLQKPSITEPNGNVPGSATASFSFSQAGVYKVTLTITDACGNSGTATTLDGLELLVVVYDPSAGFVTGGGWIYSPAGAYVSKPTLSGKANFGFNSQYKKGANVPTGETEFQFQVGDFDFHSTSYQWLVVSGYKAQYKGIGTVNRAGKYGFLLTAYDGGIKATGNDGRDRFRIKIWAINSDGTDGQVVYDNSLGASEDIDAANPTALGGGSIVIHK